MKLYNFVNDEGLFNLYNDLALCTATL